VNLKHRNAGFSLIEVLCAVLILGIGLTGLTYGVTTALTSSKESELQTAAALIAAGRIETLRAEGYLINGQEEGEMKEGLSLYRWKQSVSSADIDGLHEVEVVVENSRTGKAIYEVRTMLFDASSTSTSDQEQKKKQDPAKSKRREGRKR
jgi:type IV pilus modification protein PilV